MHQISLFLKVEQTSNNGGAITTLFPQASKEKNRDGRAEQVRDGVREEKKQPLDTNHHIFMRKKTHCINYSLLKLRHS